MSAADLRGCSCGDSHPTFQALAQCVWPEAEYVLGEGPFATVRGCIGLTVMLHPTRPQAESAFSSIHHSRPKGGCDYWKHELLVLTHHALEDLL